MIVVDSPYVVAQHDLDPARLGSVEKGGSVRTGSCRVVDVMAGWSAR
jgi:hypothetical protein